MYVSIGNIKDGVSFKLFHLFDAFFKILFAVLASVGGLYTSIVVKYTDNIMKGFSAAAAIVISTVASVILFGLQISEFISHKHIFSSLDSVDFSQLTLWERFVKKQTKKTQKTDFA